MSKGRIHFILFLKSNRNFQKPFNTRSTGKKNSRRTGPQDLWSEKKFKRKLNQIFANFLFCFSKQINIENVRIKKNIDFENTRLKKRTNLKK